MLRFKQFLLHESLASFKKIYKNPDQDTLEALAHQNKERYWKPGYDNRMLRYVDHGGHRWVKSAAHSDHAEILNKTGYQPHTKFNTGFYTFNKHGKLEDEKL